MNERSLALIARIERLRAEIVRLRGEIRAAPSGGHLLRRLTTASTAVATSYEAACAAGWGDGFVVHISAAARHAKRMTHLLRDFTHLNHVSIEASRDLILEARGIENILTASKNTSRRRQKVRRAAVRDRCSTNTPGSGSHQA